MTDSGLDRAWHPATRAVAAGRPERTPGAPVNPPVTFTSTYVAGAPVDYARVGNPTWTELEAALGALEGGAALTFASGMAAVAAVTSLVPLGGAVVAPRHAYNGTRHLLAEAAERGELTLHLVDVDDAKQVEDAMPGADLVLLESPTNPMLEVADLPRLIAASHTAGALVAVDNTFATPLLQQPLAMGADLVVHSVTKALSGHSDLLLGAVVAADDEPGRALLERIHAHRSSHGAIPGPMEAWLALRGLRTLDVRIARAGATAAALAERLAGHPAVSEVRYPGFGTIVAIRVAAGAEAAERCCAAVRLWTHSTSLGGVESQLERRRRHPLEAPSVPEDLVRLSVGIEHPEDLWSDLDQALRAAPPG